MNMLEGYRKGINLGGWISQYKRYLMHERHFDDFITLRDIERIAQWGFDHVRLPFDYDILEDDSKPGIYSEKGFSYIDCCLEWCERCGLNVVRDRPKFCVNLQSKV